MNELRNYFEQNEGRLINKFDHYFDVYERYFSKFRNKKITIVEIGVYQGGSLQMWRKYFGKEATIWGIDIDPRCKSLEDENTHILIGSQEDPLFLRSIIDKIGMIDILIDDGGHTQDQQIISFKELYQQVNPDGGIYLCEDVHTSYINVYGGGHKRNNTFIEYSKSLIDQLNAHYTEQSSIQVNEFTKTTNTIHFYDSIVVFERKIMATPSSKMTGKWSFENEVKKKTFLEKLKFHILLRINKVLQILKLRGICVDEMIRLSCMN
jgi:23S rRNA U2552 (ribose-2'-O)-methylase RlmE/FtsJ